MNTSFFKCPQCNAIVEIELPVDSMVCECCGNAEPIPYQTEQQEALRREFVKNATKPKNL